MRVTLTLASFLALILATPAIAQVTVNPGALDLLPKPATRPAPAHPAPQRPSRPAAPAPATTIPATVKPAPSSPTAAPGPPPGPPAATIKPNLPAVPPVIAALPPPAPVPPPRPQPVPIVPVAADAPGAASAQPGGVRITFGPDRSDLNPATERALRAFAATVRTPDTVTITIAAYAAGTPDDASSARRLALARALAARAVLINEGIASPRIYPRSMGATGGDTDPDRVDVTAGAPGPPAYANPPIATPASTPAGTPAPPRAPPAPQSR